MRVGYAESKKGLSPMLLMATIVTRAVLVTAAAFLIWLVIVDLRGTWGARQ